MMKTLSLLKQIAGFRFAVSWRRARAWLGLGCFLFCSSALQAQTLLPACFTDNMVLQRPTAATKDDDEVLWGWLEKSDTIRVGFSDNRKPIKAGWKRVPPNLRRWVITYGDLKGRPGRPDRSRSRSRTTPAGSY